MDFDVIIKNGVIYDGSGEEPYTAEIGIIGDKIREIGDLSEKIAKDTIDAKGLAVAPGFINMLSWATESLIEDGRSLSNIKQGVTLEVMGEGWSMGPLTDQMKKEIHSLFNSEIEYDVEWTTLGEYLEYLEDKGISTNVASFVGATTIRIHELGYEDRKPTPEELTKMKALVEDAMQEGALGVGSSLIYPPAFFADENELIELCKSAAKYDGMHISHIRSEGMRLLEGLDELFLIAKEANIRSEVYHLKAAGQSNWNKLDLAIDKIDQARKEGLDITCDMYTYSAAGTGLQSCLPPWVQDGGNDAMFERLINPELRLKIINEMSSPSDKWENLYQEAGPENIMISSLKSEKLKGYMGKRISELAIMSNKTPQDTIIDLILAEKGWIGCIYFIMDENNVRKKIQIPYMSFGSDGESSAPEGVFLKSGTHPRAYGNVARLLGKYVRDEKLILLEEAIRKLTSLPASNLKINQRGLLKRNYFADIVIFDPNKVQDHATFENPRQLATGMFHVIVNGIQVLKDGVHTGQFPGKFIRGPGWNVFDANLFNC
ncbi:MAG: N-acyl-D-amino-acid deacylase family protein [Candidatus Kariarchaeaceae archaeon]|jgi:N-acyl-D-amino-acid deacylase